METFKAAAVQLSAQGEEGETLARAEELVREAAAQGASLVALPELFYWSGRQREEAARAETIPGPLSHRMGQLAAELGIYLAPGSLLETAEDRARCFNSALLFGPDGALLAHYRKVHLFSVDIPGKATVDEGLSRQGGAQTLCVETALARVGMSICYDLRFPELYRELAGAGAELLLVPSAFTRPTGTAHWHTLLRARAIENQCYLVAANQWGPSSHGFHNYGHSLIVDPWGEVVAEAEAEGDMVIVAELDRERLSSVREQLPALGHRRLGP